MRACVCWARRVGVSRRNKHQILREMAEQLGRYDGGGCGGNWNGWRPPHNPTKVITTPALVVPMARLVGVLGPCTLKLASSILSWLPKYERTISMRHAVSEARHALVAESIGTTTWAGRTAGWVGVSPHVGWTRVGRPAGQMPGGQLRAPVRVETRRHTAVSRRTPCASRYAAWARVNRGQNAKNGTVGG